MHTKAVDDVDDQVQAVTNRVLALNCKHVINEKRRATHYSFKTATDRVAPGES
jgi:hypothetical protein